MDLAALQHESEMRSIRLHIADGSPAQALKQLDERGAAQELVRQQYTGRYPFELLQNADDAARQSGVSGRSRFVLTETALLVADNGSGFGKDQVEAICSLGRSSKGPGTSIGHKGLGFKSVGEITDRPQVISLQTQFQFDARRVQDELRAAFGVLPERQRIPVYAFPYPIEPSDLAADAEAISSLRADGFTTVIRLPFQDGVEPDLVAETLVANLNSRLLLFLPSIDHLELRGTDADFSAEAARDPDDGVDRVYMVTDQRTEEWLVYRGSTGLAAEVLQPLGDEWSQLTEAKFAVAVPLDADVDGTRPRTDETFPLHVYFPTEEAPGLRVAVHAEWVLTMDRRAIAHTAESSALNEQILSAIAEFVASTVAVDLVRRCDRSVEGIRSLVPEDIGNLSGAAATLVERWHSALASVAFLPLADSDRLCRPDEVVLLPESIPDLDRAHQLFALPANHTLRADIEADEDVRIFVLTAGQCDSMTDAQCLSLLAVSEATIAPDLYSFLIAWRRRNWSLVDDLRAVQCVLTTTGEFLSTAEHSIFFPRRDESVPDDIPVPIVALPDVDGVDQLLRDLGVKSFEWRDLIRDYLIKILEDADADPHERARAMKGLRAYQASRRDSSEVGPAYLGRVLLPARSADGSSTGFRPAGRVYFGREWTHSTELEAIYGPFDQSEFLAVEAPTNSRERDLDEAFYRMLGVIDHPRVVQAGGAHQHLDANNIPHRRTSLAIYNEWLEAVGARRCLQDHDSSFQRLLNSFHVDRLEQIFAAEDPRRNRLLWNQFARHWGKDYEDATVAQIHCDHRYHSTERVRQVDSLFSYTLRSRAWVPVLVGNNAEVVRPDEAWFETVVPPARIRSRIPLISHAMHHTRGGPAVVQELGLIDTSDPRVEDLLTLLKSVAAEAHTAGSTGRDIDVAARWIQRSIDDVLSADSEPHDSPEDVPLLAMHNGETSFVRQPLYADDAMLRDTWQRVSPILLADNDSGRLKKYFRLIKLDDEIETVPIPLNIRRGEAMSRVVQRIRDAEPYIVALIGSENSRMQAPAVRALRHLEVVVCEQLLLRYRYDGNEVERDDAPCFIAEPQAPADGRRSQPVGTAYIELYGADGEPNWFAVGSQLALHLGVGGYKDAVTMLLKVDKIDRDRMMASRHIPAEAVAEARARLELDPVEDQPSINLLDSFTEAPRTGGDDAAAELMRENVYSAEHLIQEEPTQSQADASALTAPPHVAASTPLPPIDVASINISDANTRDVDPVVRSAPGRSASVSFGAVSSAPSAQTETEKRRVGKRGEEIVYLKERERIEKAGSNPDLVVWQSKEDELAPVDIISVDDNGDVIYIEVKSTIGSDPGDPFYISAAELLEASSQGNRYFIYRVTDTYSNTPLITRWRNPIELVKNGQGRLLLSTAQMKLGLESPELDE